MARLDAEEAEARAVATPVDPKVALEYLADLPRLWAEAAPERRQQHEATIHPSPEAVAHGWRAAWGDDS